jgi:hypothetical protein
MDHVESQTDHEINAYRRGRRDVGRGRQHDASFGFGPDVRTYDPEP